jgi:hypothetical protein
VNVWEVRDGKVRDRPIDERIDDGSEACGAQGKASGTERLDRPASQLQVQRLAELRVQERESRKLDPVRGCVSLDGRASCLAEAGMLDLRKLRVADYLAEILTPAGHDDCDVRIPPDRCGQDPQVVLPPLGALALVERVDDQQAGASGRLSCCVEEAEDVINGAAELTLLADPRRRGPAAEVLAEHHDRRLPACDSAGARR